MPDFDRVAAERDDVVILGIAVEDDPALRTSVFERLRPTAPRFTGTLVAIAVVTPNQAD